MNEPSQLIPSSFLFRFAVPCYYLEDWETTAGAELPERHHVPSFGELDDRPVFGDLRIGWNPAGLGVSLRVTGKSQTPMCRATRVADSDGLSLLIDTRPSGGIHRASRFCHHFRMLPAGAGRGQREPYATLLPISRARDNPRTVPDSLLAVRAEKRIDGYLLRAAIPAEALTGFAPDEIRHLGFTYAIMDRELGWQTLGVGGEFPILSDPSLWGQLDLIAP